MKVLQKSMALLGVLALVLGCGSLFPGCDAPWNPNFNKWVDDQLDYLRRDANIHAIIGFDFEKFTALAVEINESAEPKEIKILMPEGMSRAALRPLITFMGTGVRYEIDGISTLCTVMNDVATTLDPLDFSSDPALPHFFVASPEDGEAEYVVRFEPIELINLAVARNPVAPFYTQVETIDFDSLRDGLDIRATYAGDYAISLPSYINAENGYTLELAPDPPDSGALAILAKNRLPLDNQKFCSFDIYQQTFDSNEIVEFLFDDILTAGTIETSGDIRVISVLIPDGVSPTSLHATILYTGASLFYQDNADWVLWPSGGEALDWTSPRRLKVVANSGVEQEYEVVATSGG